MVLAGFVTAWRFASWPTRRSPVLVKATTDGIVRPPSAEAMTVGSPPSMTATTEFVVPRSMPMILPILVSAPGSVGGCGCRFVEVAGSSVGVVAVGRIASGRIIRIVAVGPVPVAGLVPVAAVTDRDEGGPEDPIGHEIA